MAEAAKNLYQFEDLPEEQPVELEQVLAEYKETGKIELSSLDTKQAAFLIDYYSNNLNEFDHDQQTQLMEQLLAYELIDNSQAIDILEKLPESARMQIGEYVGKTLEPAKFFQVFHSLYKDLPDDLQRQFRHQFTVEEPENAIMVAPFPLGVFSRRNPSRFGRGTLSYISTAGLNVPDQDENGQDTTVPLLEKHYGSFESFKPLFESVLQHGSSEVINDYIQYLSDKNRKSFLLPYLPDLINRGVVDREFFTKIIKDCNFYYNDFYLSEEEKDEKKKLMTNGYVDIDELSMKESARVFALHDVVSIQSAEHVFRAFEKYQEILSAKEIKELLSNLIVEDFSVFLFLEKFNQPALISQILAELESNYQFLYNGQDIKILIATGYEKQAFQILYTAIEGHYFDINSVLSFVDVIAEFDKNKQKILLEQIMSLNPAVFLLRPDLVHKFGFDIDKLINQSASDSGNMINHYNQITYNLKHGLPKDEYEKKKQTIDQNIKGFYENDPVNFLWNPKGVSKFFTEEQVLEIFLNQVEAQNIEFIYKFISSYRSQDSSDFGNSIRDKVLAKCVEQLKNPVIFEKVLEANYNIPDLEFIAQLLTPKRFLRLMNNKQVENLETITDLMPAELLLEFPDQQIKLFDKLKKLDQPDSVFNIVDKASILLKYKDVTKKEKQQRQEFYDRAEELFYEVVEKDPSQLFIRDRLHVKQTFKLEAIIEENYLTYFKQHPDQWSKAVSMYQYENLTTAQVKDVLEQNLQYIIYDSEFLNVDYEGQSREYEKLLDFLEPEQIEEINNKNPFLSAIEQAQNLTDEQLEQWDFYSHTLSQLEGLPLYNIYQKKLKKLVKSENKAYNNQVNLSTMHKNIEFIELARRISLLSHSQIVLDNLDYLTSLPETERERIFSLIETSLTFNLLDDENQVQIDDNNFEEIKDNLNKELMSYISQIFNIDANSLNNEQFIIKPEDIKILLVYYQQVCKNKKGMAQSFQDLVLNLVQDNYQQYKWYGNQQEAGLADLKEQGLLPKGLKAEQFETWQEELNLETEALIEYNAEGINRDIKQQLQQAVADGHLEQADLPTNFEIMKLQYDELYQPLQVLSKRQKELQKIYKQIKKGKLELSEDEKSQLETEFQNNKEQISEYLDDNQLIIEELQAKLYLARLRTINAAEIEKDVLVVGKNNQSLKKVFKTILEYYQQYNPEFVSDINRIKQLIQEYKESMFGQETTRPTNLTVTDKVDFSTYFKIGEEPVPSCQSYRSESSMNEGLLSYVIDPNVKIIQIYNEKGNIIARSALRLLSDEKGQGQLFLERIYSVTPHSAINKVIINFAKEKAKQMKVKVYTHAKEMDVEDDSDKPIEANNLSSDGSRNAYVYTDAGGGKVKDGKYNINRAFAL